MDIPTPAPVEYVAQEEDLNPFLHSQSSAELTEHLIGHYMYGMVKQKVISPYYRVTYEMTPERIEWLLHAVENRNDLPHAGVFLDILSRWQQGDFSQAVNDHNTLYRLMGGEIGRGRAVGHTGRRSPARGKILPLAVLRSWRGTLRGRAGCLSFVLGEIQQVKQVLAFKGNIT